MARLRWTPQALEDIEAICTYIARDSDYYARIEMGACARNPPWQLPDCLSSNRRRGRDLDGLP